MKKEEKKEEEMKKSKAELEIKGERKAESREINQLKLKTSPEYTQAGVYGKCVL